MLADGETDRRSNDLLIRSHRFDLPVYSRKRAYWNHEPKRDRPHPLAASRGLPDPGPFLVFMQRVSCQCLRDAPPDSR